MKKDDVNLVISHGNCPDGTAAAMAAKLYLRNRAEYFFANHGDEHIPNVDNKNVLFLDFAYPLDIMNEVVDEAKSVLVLDHHEKTRDKLEGQLKNCEMLFDMNKSGAMLSWEFFFPNTEAPDLIKYVQDRDLYKWKLEDSFPYLLSLDCFPNTISSYMEALKTDSKHMISKGEIIKEYFNAVVETYVEKAKIGLLTTNKGDELCFVLNNCMKEFTSEIGNILARRDRKIFALIWYFDSGKYFFSLRSEVMDVGEIASRFPGGGGHRLASGFQYVGDIRNIIRYI